MSSFFTSLAATTFKSGLINNLSASRRGGQSIAYPGPLSWLGSLRAPPPGHRPALSHRLYPTFPGHSRRHQCGNWAPALGYSHAGPSACACTARAPPLPKLSASTRRRGPRLGTLYQCQGRASRSTHARTPTHAHARTRCGPPPSARISWPNYCPGRSLTVRLSAARPWGQVRELPQCWQPFFLFSDYLC